MYPGDLDSIELEDILISDDTFLSYFNAYLALPIFSRKVYYNRLAGVFTVLNDELKPLDDKSIPSYGATDEERMSMLNWALHERFRFFKKSVFYREYTLCKLLSRPNVHPPPREQLSELFATGLFKSNNTSVARGLTGVSRHSNSSEDDRFLETENEYFGANGEVEDNDSRSNGRSEENENSDLVSYDKFSQNVTRKCNAMSDSSSSVEGMENPSQELISEQEAISGTEILGGPSKRSLDYAKYFMIKRQSTPWTAVHLSESNEYDNNNNNVERHMAEQSTGSSAKHKSRTNLNSRRKSEPARQDEWSSYTSNSKRSVGSDALSFLSLDARSEGLWLSLDGLLDNSGQSSLFSNCWQNETEDDLMIRLQQLQERQNIPLQRLKELLLSSREGMADFICFLLNTSGIRLLDFWLDCEAINTCVENREATEQAKCKFSLMR
ncbi:unnamed protein product [Dicrocoelium dendriticum]|nr:unnamed protein product [Dicrocoelium dendriticum]